MRQECLNRVYELAKKDERVIYVGSDLAAGTLDKFKNEFPKRFFMERIAEMNLAGTSAGLAMECNIVYFNTISTFITRRCFEQVVLDMCLHNVNVRLLGNGGGVVYAPLGPTHLAIEDLSILRAIPNMTVVAPCDPNEMERAVDASLNYNGPMYLRIARGGEEIVSDPSKGFEIGKAICMHDDGSDVLIITTGVTPILAIEAANELKKNALGVTVLHNHTVKPLDFEMNFEYIKKAKIIVTIEENTIIGGLGSAISELIAEAGFEKPKKFKRIGIPDVFPNKYGNQKFLMDYYGISSENLVKVVKGLAE